MLFLENGVCAPSGESELLFCETALEGDLMFHQNCQLINQYEIIYLEDGDEGQKDGVISSIVAGIKKMLDKIRTLIDGIIDSVKMGSKKRLTADAYMASETGQLALEADIVAMKKAVDEEYLSARTVVKMIANITHEDPKQVASMCDKINQRLTDNRHKFVGAAGGLVRAGAAIALSKDSINKCEEIKEMAIMTDKSVENLKKNTGQKIKPEVYNSINKFTHTLYKLSNDYSYISDAVEKSIAKSDKKHAKQAKKEAKKKKKGGN